MNALGDVLYVSGGKNDEDPYRGNLHVYSRDIYSSRWDRIKGQGTPPRNRFGHTSTMTAPKRLLIIGGQDVDSDEILFDDPILDLETRSWISPASLDKSSPLRRTFHSANLIGNSVYIFGGFNGDKFLNDLIVYNLESREVKRLELASKFAPHARAGHATAACDDRGFIIHGGYSEEGLFNDFWFFDIRDLSWSLLRSPAPGRPSARHGHSLSFISRSRTLLLIGGLGEGNALQDSHFTCDFEGLMASAVKSESPSDVNAAVKQKELVKSTRTSREVSAPSTPLRETAGMMKESEVTPTKTPDIVTSSPLKLEKALSHIAEEADSEGGRDYEKLYRESVQTMIEMRTSLTSKRQLLDAKDAEIAHLKKELETFIAENDEQDSQIPMSLRMATSDALFLFNQLNVYLAQQRSLQRLIDDTYIALEDKLERLASMSDATTKLVRPSEDEILERRSSHKRDASTGVKGKKEREAELQTRKSSWFLPRRESFGSNDPRSAAVMPNGQAGAPGQGSDPDDKEKKKSKLNMPSLNLTNKKEETPEQRAARAIEKAREKEKKREDKEKEKERDKERERMERGLLSPRRSGATKNDGAVQNTATVAKPGLTLDLKEKKKVEFNADDKDKDKAEHKETLFEKALLSPRRASTKLSNLITGTKEVKEVKRISVGNVKKEMKFDLNLHIVEECCTYLEDHVELMGIFRVSGSSVDVDSICLTFTEPETVSVQAEPNPHNVTGALKQYLRTLDDPVVPFSLYEEAARVATVIRDHEDDIGEQGDGIAAVKEFIAQLPELNRAIFERLLRLLVLVVSHSEANKMDSNNMAIVFGPTLIRQHPSKETPMTVMENTEKSRSLISFCISHFQEIFS